MIKKLIALITFLTTLVVGASLSYADETHGLQFSCSETESGAELSWNRFVNENNDHHITHAVFMLRKDGTYWPGGTFEVDINRHPDDYDPNEYGGNVLDVIAFEEVDLDLEPSGSRTVPFETVPGQKYYCGAAQRTTGDLSAGVTVSSFTASKSNDTDMHFSVELTSNPTATDIPMGESKLEAEVGDIITFTRHIEQSGVINNAWYWTNDSSKLDCAAHPEFDSPSYRCEVIAAGSSPVSIIMYPIMADQTKRTIQSNLIIVEVEDDSRANEEESFDSDCKFAPTRFSDTEYRLQLVNKNTNERDGLCRVISYRVENYGNSTAEITGMTEYSLNLSFSEGDKFTVYVEKDGEAINRYFEINGSEIINKPSTNELPPAGYEDEVLVNPYDYRNPFPDTNINQLSGQAAAELYRRGVIGGYPDGEFKKDRWVNRAEVAKFLLLAREINVQDLRNNGRFWDAIEGEWYVKYIITAAEEGILSGHPDGSFKPDFNVNTAEFLKMLTLTFDLEENISYTYTDVEAGSWYQQYAGVAQKYDLFPHRTAQLLPANELTRQEVAIAIYQFLSNR